MTMQEKISKKLIAAFSPTQLEVINESHLHAGHSGDDGSGESHFCIKIAAKAFDEMNRIDRQRAVHRALGEELQIIHALSIQFLSD